MLFTKVIFKYCKFKKYILIFKITKRPAAISGDAKGYHTGAIWDQILKLVIPI